MKDQHKATLAGMIVGIVIGLLIALAVSVYINKVPVPFRDHATTRSAEQDAAEAKKNKDWNPNAPLQSQGKPRTPTAPQGEDATARAAPQPLKPLTRPSASGADPLGDLAKARTATGPGNEQSYVIQVGAYQSTEDAESQRAKLSLMGLDSKVSEIEKGDKTLYRVRIGPIAQRAEAESVRSQLHSAGYETTLLRLQH